MNPWLAARNLLAVRLDNAGDVVMLGPALRAIKTTSPECRITLLASPAGAKAAPLLPWVDSVLVWRSIWQDLGHLPFDPARENELIQLIAERSFDAAVIFSSFSQTPHVAAYACYLAGIPLRAGESKEFGGATLSTELRGTPDETLSGRPQSAPRPRSWLHRSRSRSGDCHPRRQPGGGGATPVGRRDQPRTSHWRCSIPAPAPKPAAIRRRGSGRLPSCCRQRGWPLVVTGSEREREPARDRGRRQRRHPDLHRPVDPGVRGTRGARIGGRLRQHVAPASGRRDPHAGRRALLRHGHDLAMGSPLRAIAGAATGHGLRARATASPARSVCPASMSIRKRSSRRSRRSCRSHRSAPAHPGW